MSKFVIGQQPSQADLGVRDAVHIPIVVALCDESVSAGDFVAFDVDDENAALVHKVNRDDAHGMVDPWMSGHTPAGVPFLVSIKPDIVSDVVHSFQITDVPSKEDRAAERAYRESENFDGCWGCG